MSKLNEVTLSESEKNLIRSELTLFKKDNKTEDDVLKTIENIMKYKVSSVAERIFMDYTKSSLNKMEF